jgi:glutamate/tyrosine decarboxylase-like PLP-dependent enzyme
VSTPTRLTAQDLARELDRESEVPTIVLTQAGDIHTGESEAFADLVPVAHARGAWVHVDGAFGLWARASESKRHCLEGVETADSWAVDGHKWLNVPFDSGYAFVAHPAAHRGAMGIDAPYVATSQHAREPLDWTPEWSRRARAFATYAAIFELGRDGVEEMINRTCDRATQLVEGLGRLPGMEIVRPVVLNQGLVGVCSHADTNAEDRTERLLANPKLRRETLLQASTWQGRKVIRVSVCSWRTTEEDVDRAIRAVAEALDAQ